MISYIKYKIKIMKIRSAWRKYTYLRRLLKRNKKSCLGFQRSYMEIKIITSLELA